jgi:hypothetical protein
MLALNQNDYSSYAGIIQLGDISYDLHTDRGSNGDNFFDIIQPFAATWPFVMIAGNHEVFRDFSFMRFRMRNPLFYYSDHRFYSYNWQGIHFVSLNSDFFILAPQETQNEILGWLYKDLATANSAENREQWPWVVFLTHRPVYCSCSPMFIEERKRCYAFYNLYKRFDEMFYTHKVDLVLSAHVHYYERMAPIYQNKTANYTSPNNDTHIMVDPDAPIHIVEAISGQKGYITTEFTPTDYTMFHDSVIGYGEMYAMKTSTGRRLVYEHRESSTGNIIDYLYIDKTDKAKPIRKDPITSSTKGTKKTNPTIEESTPTTNGLPTKSLPTRGTYKKASNETLVEDPAPSHIEISKESIGENIWTILLSVCILIILGVVAYVTLIFYSNKENKPRGMVTLSNESTKADEESQVSDNNVASINNLDKGDHTIAYQQVDIVHKLEVKEIVKT